MHDEVLEARVFVKLFFVLLLSGGFCSSSFADAAIPDEELAGVRGGMMTLFFEPSFDANDRFTSSIDNERVRFAFSHYYTVESVLIQVYSGPTKAGFQLIETVPQGGTSAGGVYSSRLQSFPLGSSYKDFKTWVSDANNQAMEMLESGQPGDIQKNRKLRYDPDLDVFRVKFHMLREPDGDESFISTPDAQDMVDNMERVWTQTQHTQSSDVYLTNDCPIPNRVNFRFDSLDVLNVGFDGMATSVTSQSPWGDRFRNLANTLDPDYYHVFLVEDIPGLAGFAGFNHNYTVLSLSQPKSWLAGTFSHEFGHSVGLQHVNDSFQFPGLILHSQYDNCGNAGNNRNLMCGNGHGVQVEPLQCAEIIEGPHVAGVRRVIDFNN